MRGELGYWAIVMQRKPAPNNKTTDTFGKSQGATHAATQFAHPICGHIAVPFATSIE
jgi:hypothetical protein